MKEKKPTSVTWRKMILSNKELYNILWSEEARNPINSELIYKLYYDKEKNSIILVDNIGDVSYVFPPNEKYKAKAYTLAFKLLLFN